MVLDIFLLNPQLYEVRVKVKVEQSREQSNFFPLHRGRVAIENRDFRSASIKVTNNNNLSYNEVHRGCAVM